MKKLLALLLAGLLVFSAAGCIVINQETSGTEEASKTQEPTVEPTTAEPKTDAPETSAPATEGTKATEAPATDAPATDAPESGKTLPWANEPQASEDMRYPYEWLAGLYKVSASIDGDEMSAKILFYENGLFTSEEYNEGFNDGRLGSYIIIGDTIYLHEIFGTGGGVGANVASYDYIMGINNNGTLMSGNFLSTPGMLEFSKASDAERAEFESDRGFDKVVQENLLPE